MRGGPSTCPGRIGERPAAAGRFAFMTGNLPADQGRAPHLYDEQLQRQQQEKMLLRGAREQRPDLLNPPPR
jgi:hypothetical protein